MPIRHKGGYKSTIFPCHLKFTFQFFNDISMPSQIYVSVFQRYYHAILNLRFSFLLYKHSESLLTFVFRKPRLGASKVNIACLGRNHIRYNVKISADIVTRQSRYLYSNINVAFRSSVSKTSYIILIVLLCHAVVLLQLVAGVGFLFFTSCLYI